LEQSAIRIERARIKDGVFRPEEFRQRSFEFLMNVLCAANEAHTGHAEAMRIERLLGRGDESGMIGQAEIVIRTHVEDALSAGHFNLRVLRCGDDALRFVETLGTDFIECARKLLIKLFEHRATSAKEVAMQKRPRKLFVTACE